MGKNHHWNLSVNRDHSHSHTFYPCRLDNCEKTVPETVILTQNYKEGGTPTSGQSSNQVLLVVVVLADFIILGP